MEAKRITDALNTSSADDSRPVGTCGPEYSTVCPFNADTSKVLVLYRSYFALHDVKSGRFLKHLPLEIHARSCPRWSISDPNVLYFFEGRMLQEYHVSDDHIYTLWDFKEYETIGNGGESDISEDGNHLVIAGDHRSVFVYEISTRTKGPVFETDGRWNALYITPDNNVLICWDKETGRGIDIWRPWSMTAHTKIAPILSHQAVSRDADGSEILLWANSPDPSVNNNGIEKIRLSDGKRTLLHAFGWDQPVSSSLIVHIGCPQSHPVYAIVETWDKENPNSTKPYANAILRLWFDGEIEEIAKHHSFAKTYEGQPKTAVSRDGTKLLFGSNSGITNPEAYSDAYLLDLAGQSGQTPSPIPAVPMPIPVPVPDAQFLGFTKTDFRYAEGKEWLVRFKVVNGQLTSEIWEKG